MKWEYKIVLIQKGFEDTMNHYGSEGYKVALDTSAYIVMERPIPPASSNVNEKDGMICTFGKFPYSGICSAHLGGNPDCDMCTKFVINEKWYQLRPASPKPVVKDVEFPYTEEFAIFFEKLIDKTRLLSELDYINYSRTLRKKLQAYIAQHSKPAGEASVLNEQVIDEMLNWVSDFKDYDGIKVRFLRDKLTELKAKHQQGGGK